MISYVIRRLFYMIALLLLLSVVTFVIIQLPPGNFLSAQLGRLRAAGTNVTETQIINLTRRYGLDLPMHTQFVDWFTGLFRGDFGMSFQHNRPVAELIGERLILTIVIAMITLVFTYVVSVPIGIYSATHQYSIGDYAFTTVGFAGLAIPNFMLALVLMLLFNRA